MIKQIVFVLITFFEGLNENKEEGLPFNLVELVSLGTVGSIEHKLDLPWYHAPVLH